MAGTQHPDHLSGGVDSVEPGIDRVGGIDGGYVIQEGYYDTESLDDEVAALRPSSAVEGQTGWVYLGLLLVLFVVLIATSWACNDRTESASSDGSAVVDRAADGALVPVSLTVTVEGDSITLRGSVPDESARAQMVSIATQEYDEAKLIDQLEVDSGTTLDEGSIRVSGVAAEGDTRPDAVKQAIVSGFGLADGGTEVQRTDAVRQPVDVEVRVSSEVITLVGQVPDEASVADLSGAVAAVWDVQIDAGLLIVSDAVTWTDGQVRVTGASPPGDERPAQFAKETLDRIAALSVVDLADLGVDTSAEALGTVEAEIAERLVANPILFAPQSAEIDAGSDAVLESVAEILQEVPAVNIELVGHTDDVGPDSENLLLSQQRAEAVMNRLIELGVDASRLNSRGVGETQPLVANDTPENRELNRRIEFKLIAQ